MSSKIKKYKEIHIWEFPLTKTFIGLNSKYRIKLFEKVLSIIGSQQKLAYYLNHKSLKYGLKRKYWHGNIFSWKQGTNGRKKANIPLWVILEFTKILTNNKRKRQELLREIELNIEFYTGWGKSNPIYKPKLPILLTPELTSVIFHLIGDGHIGRPEVSSSYKQINPIGLNNFLNKLINCFGKFSYSKLEFKNGRLNIPKIITEFYVYYFKLPNTNTFIAYIPENLKSMERKFLIAALTAFIIDEAYIGEVIQIYSKNKKLLNGIRDIGLITGYICHPIREKYARDKFDSYRFNISIKSYKQIANDIDKLCNKFPTCDLAHKQQRFSSRVQR